MKGLTISAVVALGLIPSGVTPSPPPFRLRDPAIFVTDQLETTLLQLSFSPEERISSAIGQRQLAPQESGDVLPGKGEIAREVYDDATRIGFQMGVDPQYLIKLAYRESALDPYAVAKTSSAAGLYQFTENTWLCLVKEFGGRKVLAQTSQIWRRSDGHCGIDSRSVRASVLALRHDALFSTRLAAAFTLKNYDRLVLAFGRPPTRTELYALHFLGEKAGITFLVHYLHSPNQYGYEIAPAGSMANHNVFYSGRRPKRLCEIFASFRGL